MFFILNIKAIFITPDYMLWKSHKAGWWIAELFHIKLLNSVLWNQNQNKVN